MTKKIFAEISIGELLDKISILEIKLKKIKEKKKLVIIKKGNKILNQLKKKCKLKKKNNILYKSLRETNNKLWNIENKIRKHEYLNKFDKNFINLARKVYITNDKRSEIKLKINSFTKSNIMEMKSYSKYI